MRFVTLKGQCHEVRHFKRTVSWEKWIISALDRRYVHFLDSLSAVSHWVDRDKALFGQCGPHIKCESDKKNESVPLLPQISFACEPGLHRANKKIKKIVAFWRRIWKILKRRVRGPLCMYSFPAASYIHFLVNLLRQHRVLNILCGRKNAYDNRYTLIMYTSEGDVKIFVQWPWHP